MQIRFLPTLINTGLKQKINKSKFLQCTPLNVSFRKPDTNEDKEHTIQNAFKLHLYTRMFENSVRKRDLDQVKNEGAPLKMAT